METRVKCFKKRPNSGFLQPVAFAFLGPPPTPYGQDVNCSMIDHIDEDKTNNHADNLRWVNRSENNNKCAYNRFGGKVRTDLKSDEERLEAKREYNREHMRKTRQDPKKRERDRERMRELRANPQYAEKERERQRIYDAKRRDNTKADPDKAAKQREYKREWMRKKRAEEKKAKIEKSNL